MQDKRHGGAWDRGAADSYYGRPKVPHYYEGATKTSTLVTVDKMTKEEIDAYNAGFEENEASGNFKDWM